TITGTADHLEVRRSAEPSSSATANAHVGAAVHRPAPVSAVAHRNAPLGGPPKPDAAILGTPAKEAPVGLGSEPAIAPAASAAASAALGTGATLEQLIFEALRQCPKPTS